MKSYIQPETTIYDMELQEIIAASPSVGVYDSSADQNCEVEISRRRTRDTRW
jgi:hypothetical protein